MHTTKSNHSLGKKKLFFLCPGKTKPSKLSWSEFPNMVEGIHGLPGAQKPMADHWLCHTEAALRNKIFFMVTKSAGPKGWYL